MITIIDYGVGNINSFLNVYRRLDITIRVAKNANDLVGASKIILPGVGSFDYAMQRLNDSGMREKLDEQVLINKVPVIGICVGMQMMGNYSEEGTEEGLKWIDASINKFDESKINIHTKLPHMGWNDVIPVNNHFLFKGLENESLFYFLHSYYFHCNNKENIIASSKYGEEFACAINKENIYGIQFHPEKSHHYGEILLHNFAKI
ncbi:imidazole glycerol phosphate synthase subunit HisH [Pedobacter lithocola]|uniref:Imidazole glycerol phosphate synthase subunit HisH n=1 Tax=Pedobacter lithocola TaxID=1908239 RepID=A0ABV8P3S9_9SPHI